MERAVEGIIGVVRGYLPDADGEAIRRAFRFSQARHGAQKRSSGEPYLVHPLSVAQIIGQMRLDVPSVLAAFLHDCVEDTATSLDEIKGEFGDDVAFLVDGVTKLSKVEYTSKAARQAENFRKMMVAMARDIRVLLLKLADRLHNARTLEHLSEERRERIAQETLDVYAPLANRLGIDWLKGELEDLSFRYLQPAEWTDLSARVEKTRKQRERFIQEMTRTLSELVAAHGLRVTVTGRLKRMFSIHEKMRRQHIEFEQVFDLLGFRVICDTVAECYTVLGVIHGQWTPVPGRFKDHIGIPKQNGYQSLHTTVMGPRGIRMEIQIRTHEMHKIAVEGIAAHWMYKEGGGLAPGGKDAERFRWLHQIWELQKDVRDPTELMDAVKGDLFTDEVYVFTPAGQVQVFPSGATPVDFAYSIHTDLGHHCSGARVNGAIVPLRYELRSGDSVEILTNPQQKPNKDWLDFVVTSRARSKIRSYLHAEQRKRSQELGQEMLEKEFRKAGVSLGKAEKHGDLERVAKEHRLGSRDELIQAVGYGKIDGRTVVQEVVGADGEEEKEPPAELRESKLLQLVRRVAGLDSAAIKIDTVDDLLVRLARCCNPVPGDDVVGFVSRGRGLMVHRRGCPRTLELDPDRRVSVSWDSKAKLDRPVTLRITTAHRPGILTAISQVFSDRNINISQVHAKPTSEEEAETAFTFNIAGADKLQELTRSLEKLAGVTSVVRV
ncbi:MAG: bifunctional (p)ppGpp synthetase/guanosine-3',5'-bis(diphosphate) 3'-pyrophosphohydrolase [Deltaproteobacteria bacterium]|nr:bifunctional (p)ppGpp synthetase/guanosine-3',5'-bis(diphosphate) 3'-pyrophosphohydrolase [Deltaproteobacteria bacterium]